MRKFHEFLNAKGVMKEKPEVALVADKLEVPNTNGKGGAKTPKEKYPMKNGKQHQIKEGKKADKAKKGFGDEGDKKLIYDVEKSGKAVQLPTAETYQLLPALRESIQQNPNVMEALVRDFKRNGMLGVLVGELSQHAETFHHLSQLMASESYGPGVCRKLARAMKENVSMPFSKVGTADPGMEDPDMMGDEEDDLEDPNMAPGDEEDMEDDGMGDELDPNMMGDEEMGDEEMMGDEELDPSMDPNMMGDEELDPSMDPNADPSMGGDDMGMGPMGDPNGMGAPMPPIHHRKPMRRHPAFEHFKQAMKRVH